MSLAVPPLADVHAHHPRRAGLVTGEAAESSERSAKPTLDETEHRVHTSLVREGRSPSPFRTRPLVSNCRPSEVTFSLNQDTPKSTFE
jgi:hypothetical protein